MSTEPEEARKGYPIAGPCLRDGSLRRILSVSGGGVRGVIAAAFLEAVEAEYRRRFGPRTKLCDVFDLVGGTSTGAIIAGALAVGKTAAEVAEFYLDRAERLFRRRRRWLFGFRPILDGAYLEREIVSVVGNMRLDDPAIRTRLAVVVKRLDTGSPWIVSNLPSSPYWEDDPGGRFHGNHSYSLARLLRASAAAPTYFGQQAIEIGPGERGVFVDGGASPHNDPALALFMLARMECYGLRWPTGPDRLFVLSLGTGRFRRRLPADRLMQAGPLRLAHGTLSGLIDDGELLVLTMMEWLGSSRAPSNINSEIGSLANDHAAGAPLFSYLRLDLPLELEELQAVGLCRDQDLLQRCQSLDDPSIIRPLYDLAREYCARRLDAAAHLA